MNKYEITITNTESILYTSHGTWNDGMPTIMLEHLGMRWAKQAGPVTVCYRNLSQGWRVEKDFQ